MPNEHRSDHPAGPGDLGPSEAREVVTAPQRSVLLVGEIAVPELSGMLGRMNAELRRADMADAVDVASRWGAVNLTLLDAGLLTDSRSERLIAELRGAFPSMRMVMVGDGSSLTAESVILAMRAGLQNVIDPSDLIGLRNWMERCLAQSEEGAERVLAIGAHPDDVEIGCAGALLEHRRRGDHLTVLTLSAGQVGGDGQLRLGESQTAARALGARLILADLPDTRIDPGIETIRLIEAVVASVDPSIVYVHSRHDNHQDHRAVNTAVMSASRRVPQVYAYQSPSATNDFAPTRFVPVDAVIARKVEVLASFATQSERSYLEPELVVAGARYWARHMSPFARYAEPLEVVRSLAGRTARPTSPTAYEQAAPVVPMPLVAAAAGSGLA